MTYQSFSILKFRPLLKQFFHSTHIDLRGTSGQKTPLVSAVITCLVLMFRKKSSIRFRQKRRSQKVASRQIEIPFFTGIGWDRGRRVGALAQVFGITANPLSRKKVVPAAKRVGASLLEIAAPETGNVVSGRKKIQDSSKKCR